MPDSVMYAMSGNYSLDPDKVWVICGGDQGQYPIHFERLKTHTIRQHDPKYVEGPWVSDESVVVIPLINSLTV